MQHPLRQYRADHDLPLDRVADAVGVHKSTISRIETRAYVPSLDLVARIVAATNNELRCDDFLPPKPAAPRLSPPTPEASP